MKGLYTLIKDKVFFHFPQIGKIFSLPVIFTILCIYIVLILFDCFYPISNSIEYFKYQIIISTILFIISNFLIFRWLFKIGNFDKKDFRLKDFSLLLIIIYPVVIFFCYFPFLILENNIEKRIEIEFSPETINSELLSIRELINKHDINILKKTYLNGQYYGNEIKSYYSNKGIYSLKNLEKDVNLNILEFDRLYYVYQDLNRLKNLLEFVKEVYVLYLLLLIPLLIIPFKVVLRFLIFSTPIIILYLLFEGSNNIESIPFILSNNLSLNNGIGNAIILVYSLLFIFYLVAFYFYSYFTEYNRKITLNAVWGFTYFIVIFVFSYIWINYYDISSEILGSSYNRYLMVFIYILSAITLIFHALQIERIKTLPITEKKIQINLFKKTPKILESNFLLKNYPFLWSMKIPQFIFYFLIVNSIFLGFTFLTTQLFFIRLSLFSNLAVIVNLIYLLVYFFSLKSFSLKNYAINIPNYLLIVLMALLLSSTALFISYEVIESKTFRRFILSQDKFSQFRKDILQDIYMLRWLDSNWEINNEIETDKILSTWNFNFDDIDKIEEKDILTFYENEVYNPILKQSGVFDITGKDSIINNKEYVYIDSLASKYYIDDLFPPIILREVSNVQVDSFNNIKHILENKYVGDTINIKYQNIDGEIIGKLISKEILLYSKDGYIPKKISKTDDITVVDLVQCGAAIFRRYGLPLNVNMDILFSGLQNNKVVPQSIDTTFNIKRKFLLNVLASFYDSLKPEKGTSTINNEKGILFGFAEILLITSIFIVFPFLYHNHINSNRFQWILWLILYILFLHFLTKQLNEIITNRLARQIFVTVYCIFGVCSIFLIKNRKIKLVLLPISFFSFTFLLMVSWQLFIVKLNLLAATIIVILVINLIAIYLYLGHIIIHKPKLE